MESKYDKMFTLISEVKNELSKKTHDDAVNFLKDNSNMSLDDCKEAYEFIMKINL